MVRTGEIVIAIDPDIRDMYICEVLRGDEETRRNLRVRILEMVQYPIQHAVAHPEIASENPPLPKDSEAMLQFTARVQGYTPISSTSSGAAATEEVRLRPMAEYYQEVGSAGYEASFRKCLAEYELKVRNALAYRRKYPMSPLPWRSEGELTILERHRRGEFSGRRSSAC